MTVVRSCLEVNMPADNFLPDQSSQTTHKTALCQANETSQLTKIKLNLVANTMQQSCKILFAHCSSSLGRALVSHFLGGGISSVGRTVVYEPQGQWFDSFQGVPGQDRNHVAPTCSVWQLSSCDFPKGPNKVCQ